MTRILKTELGVIPSDPVEPACVERARNRLETTDETLERIASTCGFGTSDTLVRALRHRPGTTPTEYRRRFRTVRG